MVGDTSHEQVNQTVAACIQIYYLFIMLNVNINSILYDGCDIVSI